MLVAGGTASKQVSRCVREGECSYLGCVWKWLRSDVVIMKWKGRDGRVEDGGCILLLFRNIPPPDRVQFCLLEALQ